MIWLLGLAAVLVVFVVLAADDTRCAHRRLPPVAQRRPRVPSPPRVSPPGPWHPGFHLQRGRRVRAARARRRQRP